MKSIILTLSLLFSCAVSAMADEICHFERNIGEFYELKVMDGINVDYECNPQKAGLVEFEAENSMAPSIVFEPSKDKLTIKLANRNQKYTNLPRVKVYSTYLNSVRNEGDSTVRILSVADCPKFKALLVGNGTLVVRNVHCNSLNASIMTGHGVLVVYGQAKTAELAITGTGSIQADELEATEATCKVRGTGVIACYATELLKASGLGSGSVMYRGTPQVKKTGITVRPIISTTE